MRRPWFVLFGTIEDDWKGTIAERFNISIPLWWYRVNTLDLPCGCRRRHRITHRMVLYSFDCKEHGLFSEETP